jgi:hypothetical protein
MVQTSIGKISGALGIGLGLGSLVEAGKKAVTVFATVDEQARALAVSTGRTEEAIALLRECPSLNFCFRKLCGSSTREFN